MNRPFTGAGFEMSYIRFILPTAMKGAVRRAALAEGAANTSDVVREALAEWLAAHDPEFTSAKREFNSQGHWQHKGSTDGDLST